VKTYVLFAFDMETDIGSYLKTYGGVREGTGRILAILGKHGVPATFLFTGEAALANPDVVRQVAAAGHEVGCHGLRHETVGDAHFHMPNDTPILDREVKYRLQMAARMVHDASGMQPVTFRAPRLWQGRAQVRALEKLGFLVDASYSVAAHKERILPYHPSREDWRMPGRMRLLEIPNFAFLDTETDYSRFFCGNDQWPLLRLLGADFVRRGATHVVTKQAASSAVSVLLFYLHPWEFVPMPERYDYDEGTFLFRPELSKNCGDVMTHEFDRYVGMCREDGFQFATCRDFYRIWRSNEGKR
jgi:peptidoglycan-N-acetylglucosamine deacetylase